jgi:cellulose synthase/poly-beta-1,6-N-acetylglucosamine synthase-like glycosyltransferase
MYRDRGQYIRLVVPPGFGEWCSPRPILKKMVLFLRSVQVLDWAIALAWLLQVLIWRHKLRLLPDLTRPPFSDPVESLPRLSVIVPAKNEAAGIAATLRSLLAARGISLQIIAVDDRSTDLTGEIMEDVALEAGTPLLEILHIQELPAGWLGKTHAMAMAAQRATGDWLLFTDGDIVFDPEALCRAVGYATRIGTDHMVLLPTVRLETPGERMMVAFLQVCSIWAVRLWKVPDRNARDSIGVGAFNLIRRDVYDAIGGWEALRLAVLEDLALGRRVKNQGFTTRVALGLDLVQVRWAQGAFGVVENLTKNLFALFRFRPELVLGFACGLVVFTLMPLIACLAGPAMCWPTGVLLLALFWGYQRAGKYHHFSAAQMPLYPVAGLLLVYALLRSMSLALRQKGIIWRGTFYSLRELRIAGKP